MLTSRTAALGVVGAALLLGGGSLYQALVTPPYAFPDEQAHAGYVLEVQHGRLPTIDTPIDQAVGGRALQTRLSTEPPRRRDVWVANNPPLTYLLAAGPSAVSRALGVPGGPLLGLRLMNIAVASATVAVCYFLGRDLSGGDPSVGLVSAGLVAATPHFEFVASVGYNDAVAILATTAALLGLARVAGARPPSVSCEAAIRWLGLWCLVAALARPMALMMAAPIATIGLLIVWRRREAPRLRAVAWLAGPTALGAGWFYLLNTVRYGDPTGSEVLLHKFLRQPNGSIWSALRYQTLWESTFRTISTRRFQQILPGDPDWAYVLAYGITIIGVVGAAVLVARSASRRRGRSAPAWTHRPPPPPLPALAWASTALVSLTPFLLTAQHYAGGGNPHARYLLPMLPIVATAIALTAVRLGTRWLGLLLIVLLAALSFSQVRAMAVWLALHRMGPPGSELVTAYGSESIRAASLIVGVMGLVLVLVSIAQVRPIRRVLPDLWPSRTMVTTTVFRL